MFLKVKLIGTGALDDPFRVDLPSWTMVDCDYTNKTAVVDVIEDDLPINFADRPGVGKAHAYGKQAVNKITPALKAEWREFLDKRYKEHRGKYTPDVEA